MRLNPEWFFRVKSWFASHHTLSHPPDLVTGEEKASIASKRKDTKCSSQSMSASTLSETVKKKPSAPDQRVKRVAFLRACRSRASSMRRSIRSAYGIPV